MKVKDMNKEIVKRFTNRVQNNYAMSGYYMDEIIDCWVFGLSYLGRKIVFKFHRSNHSIDVITLEENIGELETHLRNGLQKELDYIVTSVKEVSLAV